MKSEVDRTNTREEMKIAVLSFLLGTALALPTSTNVNSFADSNRQFTGDVYKEVLLVNDGNVLVSPFSAEIILALTQSGAAGATKEELRRSLHLPEAEDEAEAIVKSALLHLGDDGYVLHTANKVYVEDKFQIKEDFRRIATNVYQAEFENVEFAEPGAVDEINHWVEEETNNKIKDLLRPGDVDALTRLVLVNALYFQGDWAIPFESIHSRKLPFFTSNDDSFDVDTMYQESKLYNYYESPELDAKFLELPFKGEGASMTFILPNDKEGIRTLDQKMKNAVVAPEYTQEYVKVSLPKFKIQSTIDFGSILEELGVKAAFDPTQADFSGIAGDPGDLVISKVVQKTFIDVNEGGVEAAAATAVIVQITASVIEKPKPTKTFIADHPFAFYIKVNDIILFEGTVVEPKY